jgi:hypothetical protein
VFCRGELGYDDVMNDPRLEDHAIGVELQITELVEKIERARVQGRQERVAQLQPELDALQDELAATADKIAAGHWPHASIHLPAA